MFVLSVFEDLVRIQPQNFGTARPLAIQDELNKKYANKIVHHVGLCLRVFDLTSISDPVVHACQDGSYQCKVVFRIIVFRPFKGQILMGVIKECDPIKGVRVSLQFFDDIYIPPGYLMENTEFDREDGVWFWNWDGSQLYMDAGNWIRFRIEQLEFVDVGPIKKDDQGSKKSPLTIYASAAEPGLGLLDWWGS